MQDIINIEWLVPWIELPPDQRNYFDAELRAEIVPGHPLFNVDAIAIARRIDCDDVLFKLSDHTYQLAVVHLTYSEDEQDPNWPHTRFFSSLEDWISNCMREDNLEYEMP